jgi:ArsR family transcriptional regulator
LEGILIQAAAPPTDLNRLAQQLKLLANPKRLRIIHMLMEGIQCNCVLGDALGMSANLISHHVGLLRVAGLVDMERDPSDSRWVYYTVNETALQELNEAYAAFFDLERVRPRQLFCGPQGALVDLVAVEVTA